MLSIISLLTQTARNVATYRFTALHAEALHFCRFQLFVSVNIHEEGFVTTTSTTGTQAFLCHPTSHFVIHLTTKDTARKETRATFYLIRNIFDLTRTLCGYNLQSY